MKYISNLTIEFKTNELDTITINYRLMIKDLLLQRNTTTKFH